MSKETCYECNAETGNAGTGDGSLIVKGNPYCDDCYQEEVQKAFDERDKLEKERDELIEELEHRNYISDIKSIVNHGPVCDDLNNIEVQNGPFDGRIVWKERASR